MGINCQHSSPHGGVVKTNHVSSPHGGVVKTNHGSSPHGGVVKTNHVSSPHGWISTAKTATATATAKTHSANSPDGYQALGALRSEEVEKKRCPLMIS